MPSSDQPDHPGLLRSADRLPAAAGQAARDRSRLRDSEAVVQSEVIEFQLARQRVGLTPVDAIPQLSAREVEVLALVGSGQTDGEIAERLFISKKTASVHVANIKGKLGAGSRFEIALLASHLGLVDRPASADRTPWPGSRMAAICPFKGLASFDVADAPFFFGRERVVAELVARLAGSTFLGVVGPSGSGKSSAVRAGLVAALANGVLPDSQRWPVAICRPGRTPSAALAHAIDLALRARGLSGPMSPEGTVARLDSLPATGRLVVVVDQLEELFTICQSPDEREAFVRDIVDLASDPGYRALVVLTIRADFYGRCADFRDLADLLSRNHVLVGPMATEELVRAVEMPARAAGLRVEADLTSRLVRDVLDEPGGLPLLSTTLLELWQRRDGRTLRLATYRQIGGVSGAVSRLAEQVYGRLSPAQQSLARAIFMRLAAGGADGVPATRRPALAKEFEVDRDRDVALVLDSLTGNRLVTVNDGTVEISHEAVLSGWPRLRGWLDEDAAGRRLREHLMRAAREWEATGYDAAELYRGARLAAALDWAEAHGSELNDLEHRFLAGGRAASEREIDRQRSTNRRLRLMLAGAAILLLVAVVSGLVAARQGDIARARDLAASAINVLEDDPALSKLLALSAASIAEPPVESITALHRALAADSIVDRYTWPLGRAPVHELFVDLDPSARRLVATGSWIRRPHDYLEVVDRIEDRVLWSYDGAAAGIAVGYGFFTPDGGRVVFGGYLDEAPAAGGGAGQEVLGVHLRDADTGAVGGHWTTGPCGAAVIAVSERSALLFTSSGRNCLDPAEPSSTRRVALQLVDFETGGVTVLTTNAALADEGALSRDGRRVAFTDLSGGEPRAMMVDLDTMVRTEVQAGAADVRDLTADGSRVLIGGWGSPLVVWDVATGGTVELAASGDVTYAEFAPAGDSIYATGFDGQLRRWETATGELQGSWHVALSGRPAVTKDGLVLVPHWGTPTAGLFDTRARAELGTVDTRSQSPSPGSRGGCQLDAGRFHVAGSMGSFSESCTDPLALSLRVVDVSRLGVVRDVVHGGTGALSPDGARLAYQELRPDGDAVWAAPIRVLDVASGATIVELEGLCTYDAAPLVNAHAPGKGCATYPARPFPILAWQIRWSPDGNFIAVVDGLDAYLGVWDARDGRLIEGSLTIGAVEAGVRAFDVTFSPDSRTLFVSSDVDEGVGRLERVSTAGWTREASRDFAEVARRIGFAGFTPDGTALLAVTDYRGEGGGAMLWLDPASLQDRRSRSAELHDGSLVGIAVSPDGRLVATGSEDGSLRVWDSMTGSLVHQYAFPGTSVSGLGFVADRRLGVLLGDDGILRILTVDREELLDLARRSLTRGFTEVECDRFNFERCPTLEEIRGG